MQKKITIRNIIKIFSICILFTMLISLSTFKSIYAATTQTAKTKSKIITKEEAENSKKILELRSLNIENYEFYPEFNSNITTYYLEIPKTQTSLSINCETNVEDAEIKISGNKKLTQNENLIKISISKSGYESRTYNIYASKRSDDGPKLSSLNIENAEMTPQFESDKYFYNVNVRYTNNIESLKINAIPKDSDTKVEIFGNTADELIEGDNNVVTILLKNSEGITVYQLNATIQKNTIMEINNNNSAMNNISEKLNQIGKICSENKLPLIIASTVVVFIILIKIIIKVHKNKVKRNRQKMKERV